MTAPQGSGEGERLDLDHSTDWGYSIRETVMDKEVSHVSVSIARALLKEVERFRAALARPAPPGAYEHPEYGLTCAIGGCSLRVESSDEGTAFYVPTPPSYAAPAPPGGQPDARKIYHAGTGRYHNVDEPTAPETTQGEALTEIVLALDRIAISVRRGNSWDAGLIEAIAEQLRALRSSPSDTTGDER